MRMQRQLDLTEQHLMSDKNEEGVNLDLSLTMSDGGKIIHGYCGSSWA